MDKTTQLKRLRSNIKRIDLFLKESGIKDAFKLKKHDKVNLYCDYNKLDRPIDIDYWVIFSFRKVPFKKNYIVNSKPNKKEKPKPKKNKVKDTEHWKEKYHAYLKSNAWVRKRKHIFDIRGRYCEKCGGVNDLQIHHLTYERIFKEADEDLQVVCKTCHEGIHNIKNK